ncbi:MAG: uroporphyrinogen-III synthase [Paracoccaceae bacterium]
MAGQSHAPQLLLTRPLAQSRRFARDLRALWERPLVVTISPLMAPEFLTALLPDNPYHALIFSSETAVAAYRALPQLSVKQAFCVGQRTAQAARKADMQVLFVAEDSAGLIAQIVEFGAAGPLLHLRGEDSRGDIAVRLSSSAIATDDIVIYRQAPQPLTKSAAELLAGPKPVVLPLFSPRSAMLFGAASRPTAPLHIIALSEAVATAIAHDLQDRVMIAKSPNGPAMIDAILHLLREPPFA